MRRPYEGERRAVRMTDAMAINLNIELATGYEPKDPNAKRGDSIAGPVQETREQLAGGLVWATCSFCGGHVLVGIRRDYRERCACGARRCHHTDSRRGTYAEGWRCGTEERWLC